MAKHKKYSKPRLPHEKSGLQRFFIILSIILLCGGVLAGFYFLGQIGPKSVDPRAVRAPVQEVSPEALAFRDQSRELEARFEEKLTLRDPEPEDLEVLKQALDLQRQYLDAITGFDSESEQRLRNLEQRYQDLVTVSLRDRSHNYEAEARTLAAAEDMTGARAKFQEAHRLQKQINDDFPLSAHRDMARATRLHREARFLTAEPLMQRSLELERQAEAFTQARDWDKAEAFLVEARDMQDRLNREYRGTNQASTARLAELNTKIIAIRSGPSYLEIEELSNLADLRRMEGEHLEAAGLYEEAGRLQRQLNETFPDSPYASSERVMEFQRKRQTAESYRLGPEIERNRDRLKQLLAERRTYEAAEVIVALRRDIREMETSFPRSSLNDEELQVKVRYLNLVQNDLGFIQDRVYDALLPIPENDEWRMLRTEVPQALYSLIMGINPSRNPGDTNPVDSVSWTEAKNFCERLSWIMGKTVRLPTENEFRQALGRLRYVVLEDHVWSVSNSGGVAQEVGQKVPFASGFHDLLGNVSEWLESEDRFENEAVRHIGGHAQDRIEAIFTVPVREAPRSERNRMTGFRFVMEAGE